MQELSKKFITGSPKDFHKYFMQVSWRRTCCYLAI